MSSETENSEQVSIGTMSDEESSLIPEEEIEGRLGDVPTDLEPYQDEPLASSSSEEELADHEADIDGIPLETLEARFERRMPVDEW